MGRYDPPNPKCHHKATVRVSTHVDLAEAFKSDDGVFSTWCCSREACQEDAKEWVRASARDGREPVVVPL
jgi:hypothetical protein